MIGVHVALLLVVIAVDCVIVSALTAILEPKLLAWCDRKLAELEQRRIDLEFQRSEWWDG